MTDNNEQKKTESTPFCEQKALNAYQSAMHMWSHTGQVLWSKFNAMLVAQSIIVASVLFSFKPELTYLRMGLSFIGLLLCIVWGMITARGNSFHVYYFLSARELAEQHFPTEAQFLGERGQFFSEGASVKIKRADNKVSRRIRSFGRFLSTEKLSYIVIVLFGIIHLILISFTVWSK